MSEATTTSIDEYKLRDVLLERLLVVAFAVGVETSPSPMSAFCVFGLGRWKVTSSKFELFDYISHHWSRKRFDLRRWLRPIAPNNVRRESQGPNCTARLAGDRCRRPGDHPCR